MELTNQIYAWVGPELKDVKRSPASIVMAGNAGAAAGPAGAALGRRSLATSSAITRRSSTKRWPEFDEDKAREDQVVVAVQINGKLRDTFTVQRDAAQDELTRLALELEKVKPHVDGKQVVKTIVVPNKIVNIVVK